MTDHVDRALEQWQAERPDLDVSPMAIIGRVAAAARLVDVQLRRNFARHDLDGAAFDVLATLRRSGPPYRLTPGELMRSAMVTSGAITQRLDRLQSRDLITRTAAVEDARSSWVTLTTAGHELVDEVLPGHLATEQRLLAGLDDVQRHQLTEGLRALLDSLQPAARSKTSPAATDFGGPAAGLPAALSADRAPPK
jgi:DNA-binding MarR family transcriptional regulator